MVLGQKVKCKGYLKYNHNWSYKSENYSDNKYNLDIDVDSFSDLKYANRYNYVSKEFDGIIVDIKNIITGYVYEGEQYDSDGLDIWARKYTKVARVYYQLGRSRLVPIQEIIVE